MGRLDDYIYPMEEAHHKKHSSEHWQCWPSPVFIVSITLLEMSFFAYYAAASYNERGQVHVDGLPSVMPNSPPPNPNLNPYPSQLSSLTSSQGSDIIDLSLMSPHHKTRDHRLSLTTSVTSRWEPMTSYIGVVPLDSALLFRPDRRWEIWRFITYIVLHASWWHLIFNLLVQIVVGLPLELVHGSARVLVIYLGGALAGSLGTSVCDIGRQVYLVGASGGVYALLTAHVANVVLNHRQLELPLARLLAVFAIAGADFAIAIYSHWLAPSITVAPSVTASPSIAQLTAPSIQPSVSYSAHLAAGCAGFLLGLAVLRSLAPQPPEALVGWTATVLYMICTAYAVLLNFSPPPVEFYA